MTQQQNSIELVSVTFNAGESRLFAVSGEYFEVIDAPNPVDVLLSDFNGAQRARMNQAAASFYSKGVQYGVIQITSASSQTIRFAYGTGETGTRRSTGVVTISGPVALDMASLNAISRPLAATGNYKANGALAANTPETIFTPAANVNGAILLTAGAFQYDVSHVHTFIAKNAAPTTPFDGEILIASGWYFSSGANAFMCQLNDEQFIPAGLGLYFIASAALAAGATNHRHARFRLL